MALPCPIGTGCSAHTNASLALTCRVLQQKAKTTLFRISVQGLLRFLSIGFKIGWTLDSFHIHFARAQGGWGCSTGAGPAYQQVEALAFTEVTN